MGALQDVVVLELSTGVAGAYCTRLLSDLGAQVVKVEPPGGDPLRGEEPQYGGESLFFNYLAANKLDAVAAPGPELDRLAVHADIVVHSELGEAADRLETRLRALSPAAVILSLSPFGRSGPRSAWQTTALTEYAMGGYHYFAGDPAREPIALPGYQAEFHAGMHGALAAMAGLWHARNTGRGQVVELSHQEAMLSDHVWLTTHWSHLGIVQARTGSIFVKCADGFAFLFHQVPYPNVFVLIGRYDLLEDPTYAQPLVWTERFPQTRALFAEWAATRTKQEIYHAAQELRIALSPVNDMADVARSAQLEFRQWFREVQAGGKSFQAPGFPYRLSATPCAQERPAPRLGEHTAALLDPAFTWANAGVARLPATPAAGTGIFAGLRVVECTANWAGPLAGRCFGDLGAEVIKVELQTKPATRGAVWTGNDMTWPEHYNRSGYFNKMNRNKKDVCLDLSKPAAREAFLRLIETADVLIENNSARVMGQLGLGYEELRKVNPRLVMCSMAGYGASGPECNYAAYGSNIETSSGLASLLGYGPGEFFGTGSYYADPVAGIQGVVAIAAALHWRRQSGQGQWIDMALLESVAPFCSQQFLEYTATGNVPVPIGNRSPRFSPQGLYQSAGRDCWLAISARDERDFAALCDIIGRPDLAADPALATTEGRRTREAEIDAVIAAWAATRDHLMAAEELQAAGVPAAPVLCNWEILCDNHLNDRGFFVQVRHPRAGTHSFPGFPWRFAATPAAIYRPAPLFAEHNDEIFRGLLGLDARQDSELYATGASARAPVYGLG